MLTVSGRLSTFLPRVEDFVCRAKALDWARLTPAQLLDWLDRLGDRSLPVGHLAQLINASAGGWYTALQTILRWQMGDRGPALAAALMAGSGQVTSAAHGYRLFDLAQTARHDPAAREYLDAVPLDPHGWRRLPETSPFRIALERFLADFGHRTVYEVEMANPRWNEDPGYLLEQVRFLLANPPSRHPRDSAAAARSEAESELARHRLFLRPLVRALAGPARRGAALREYGKSLMVALWELMRYLFLEVGRRLTAAGTLERPDDVFHLAYIDVEGYLRCEWDGRGARSLVADRREQLAAWQTETPPDVLIQDVAGFSAHRSADGGAADFVSTTDADTWTGLPLSAGQAHGPACILRHPSQGLRLRLGDVLIAPSTDPGWTPLFLRASALVMEVGGYLSHGAIVAREYGIPAVSNLPGILDAVRDREPLLVDGDAGRVDRANQRR
jgi:pyruvate,water dikinase